MELNKRVVFKKNSLNLRLIKNDDNFLLENIINLQKMEYMKGATTDP